MVKLFNEDFSYPPSLPVLKDIRKDNHYENLEGKEKQKYKSLELKKHYYNILSRSQAVEEQMKDKGLHVLSTKMYKMLEEQISNLDYSVEDMFCTIKHFEDKMTMVYGVEKWDEMIVRRTPKEIKYDLYIKIQNIRNKISGSKECDAILNKARCIEFYFWHYMYLTELEQMYNTLFEQFNDDCQTIKDMFKTVNYYNIKYKHLYNH